MKQAVDGEGVILRLVERHNSSGPVTLVFDRPIEKAWTCDLMENNEAEIQASGTQLSFDIRPYEIKTLRICFVTASG